MCKYIALNKCRCIDIFINICTHILSVTMFEDQDLHAAIQATRGPLLVQNMKVSLKSRSVVGQIAELLNISDRCHLAKVAQKGKSPKRGRQQDNQQDTEHQVLGNHPKSHGNGDYH